MESSTAWAKSLFCAACLSWLGACTEGPVYTLGSQPEPQDAGPDAVIDATPDAIEDVEPDADAEPDAGPEPPILEFDPDSQREVAEVNSPVQDDNPTLTADEFEVYFTTEQGSEDERGDIWFASRDSATGEFSNPQPVVGANTAGPETSPAISLDGRFLWFGTDFFSVEGDIDIYRLERQANGTFGDEPLSETTPPEPFLLGLNSALDDIPRPPGGPQGSIMPIASRRDTRFDNDYQTFFATRNASGFYEDPMLVEDLALVNANLVDAFLTADGLRLLFQRGGRIYSSTRATLESEWSTPELIRGLPTTGLVRDPWLNPDQTRLYFTHSPSGDEVDLDIYVIDHVMSD